MASLTRENPRPGCEIGREDYTQHMKLLFVYRPGSSPCIIQRQYCC